MWSSRGVDVTMPARELYISGENNTLFFPRNLWPAGWIRSPVQWIVESSTRGCVSIFFVLIDLSSFFSAFVSAFCFLHSHSSFNFRGAVTNLLSIERRRAGVDLKKTDEPMSLSEGQRIMFAAMNVAKILCWAWRWAE